MATGTGALGDVGEQWIEATRAELGAAVGTERANILIDQYVPLVPAGYDELNWPATAAVDLAHIDELRRGDARIDTAMLRYEAAAPNEWRFRIYHRGAPLALADLLPLLDQLGFRALDERSFSFEVADGEAIRLHDVGVAVSGDGPLAEDVRAELQRTFVATATGTVEVDGSTGS